MQLYSAKSKTTKNVSWGPDTLQIHLNGCTGPPVKWHVCPLDEMLRAQNPYKVQCTLLISLNGTRRSF